MKTQLTLLSILIVSLFFLASCQHKHYGHLSKVRVKEKPLVERSKPTHETVTSNEEDKLEMQVLVSNEPSFQINKEKEQLLPKLNTPKQDQKARVATKKETSKQQEKKSRKFQKSPGPRTNYEAYVGLGFGILSSLLFLVDLMLIYSGHLIAGSIVLAFPAIILGVIGFKRYRNNKSKDGQWEAIAAIIIGGSLLLTVLLFIGLFLLVALAYNGNWQ